MLKQRRISAHAKKYDLTIEQIKEHYELEKELASRLRKSTKEERQYLYTALYDELYKRLPYLLPKKRSPEDSDLITNFVMKFLGHFLAPNSIFLEVGPGDCSVSLEVAKHVKKVYAVDVCHEFTKVLILPETFELIISDGTSIPVAENSISIVYSDQLMEHLHPDDAIEQLQNIHKALIPGGLYICNTPNYLSGRHDVTQCFDEVATGFHLKEYLVTEMYQLFLKAGFSKVSLYKSYKQISIELPLVPITLFLFKLSEKVLIVLPLSIRRTLANILILYRGMTVVGKK